MLVLVDGLLKDWDGLGGPPEGYLCPVAPHENAGRDLALCKLACEVALRNRPAGERDPAEKVRVLELFELRDHVLHALVAQRAESRLGVGSLQHVLNEAPCTLVHVQRPLGVFLDKVVKDSLALANQRRAFELLSARVALALEVVDIADEEEAAVLVQRSEVGLEHLHHARLVEALLERGRALGLLLYILVEPHRVHFGRLGLAAPPRRRKEHPAVAAHQHLAGRPRRALEALHRTPHRDAAAVDATCRGRLSPRANRRLGDDGRGINARAG